MISFSTETKVISFFSKFKKSSILRKQVRVVTLVYILKHLLIFRDRDKFCHFQESRGGRPSETCRTETKYEQMSFCTEPYPKDIRNVDEKQAKIRRSAFLKCQRFFTGQILKCQDFRQNKF